MKYSYLVGKLAGDKNNQKLGWIIGIKKLSRKSVEIKNTKEDTLTEHLIILVKSLFRKDIGVPIDSNKILKVVGNSVLLDIQEEDFKAIIKNAHDILDMPKGDITENERWKVRFRNFVSTINDP